MCQLWLSRSLTGREQGAVDPGRMGVDGAERKGGNAGRTGRYRRQNGRRRREVRVAAAIKRSE